MRLTLRTLLAYLDDILSPSDAQELEAKVNGSEYATGLVQRIRGSISRLRLSSPMVLGKGLGADANSVAEYLDNTLPVERVPEFERLCLESDMHLSEVAACHQVLTLVLNDAPRELNDEMRQRVISRVIGAGTVGGRSTTSDRTSGRGEPNRLNPEAASVDSVVDRPVRERRESAAVGPYEPPSRSWPWAIGGLALLLSFLVTLVFLISSGWFGQLGKDQIVANSGGVGNGKFHSATAGRPDPSREAQPTGTSLDADSQPSFERGADDQPDRSNAWSATDGDASGIAAPPVPPALIRSSETEDSGAQPSSESLSMDSFPLDPAVPAPGSATANHSGMSGSLSSNAEAANALGVPGLKSAVPEALSPEPSDVKGTPSAVAGNQPTDSSGIADNKKPAVDTNSDSVDDRGETEHAAAPSTAVQDIGMYMSEHQVMAVWEASTELWQRMPAREPIKVGHHFRGLPAFRSQLALNNGLQMTIDGGGEFSLGEPNSAGVPRIDVQKGRAIFVSVGADVCQLIVGAAPRELIVQQGDAKSQFAIEILQATTPGDDPLENQPHRVIKIMPLNGSISIQEPELEKRAVQVGQQWMAIDRRPAQIAEQSEYPEWTSGAIREIDRGARQELEPMLGLDRSLTLSLLEAHEHRRTDLKSLAARGLAALDRYNANLEALADRRQHPHWKFHFQDLQRAVQSGSESSRLVRDALRRMKGREADMLYRMLWGYSSAQLKAGAAADLVARLEHDELEVRVLAIENLKQITGKSLFYRADRPPAQRQNAIREWQRRLDNSEIDYAELPLLLSTEVTSIRQTP